MWCAQQLVRYLGAVCSYDSEPGALHGSLQLAAEMFDAEAGVVMRHELVAASVGLPAGHLPVDDLLQAVAGGGPLEVPGVGPCWTLAVPVEIEGEEWTMLLARSGEGFSEEEAGLLEAMATVLSLALGNLRAVAALRERKVLFERLSTIQRVISARAPLVEVFDVITASACELLGDEVAGLYLLDPVQPRSLMAASVQGGVVAPLLRTSRLWVGVGVAGRAVAEDHLIVVEGYAGHPDADLGAARVGLQATMAAPIRDSARVVGCLVVGSFTEGRTYGSSERDLLLTLADLSSLALTDARMVEELHEALGSATYRAMHDALTGLANRTRFLDRLGHALSRRPSSARAVVVLYVDIDDFKLVNDHHGHSAGDKVLVEVAGRLGAVVRGDDTVARLGGDEFAVLLESANGTSEAMAVAERLLDVLRPPVDLGGVQVPAMASVGLAVEGDGERERSAEELLRRADVAMYRAKHAGKGKVALFEDWGEPEPARGSGTAGYRSS